MTRKLQNIFFKKYKCVWSLKFIEIISIVAYCDCVSYLNWWFIISRLLNWSICFDDNSLEFLKLKTTSNWSAILIFFQLVDKKNILKIRIPRHKSVKTKPSLSLSWPSIWTYFQRFEISNIDSVFKRSVITHMFTYFAVLSKSESWHSFDISMPGFVFS